MSYNLQIIKTNGKFFVSLRSDLRDAKDVHNDGISGYKAGHRAPIYVELNRAKLQDVEVINMELGIPKFLGLAKKRQMIEALDLTGLCLNQKAVS